MHQRPRSRITILAVVGAAFVVAPARWRCVVRAPWADLSTSLTGAGAATALRLSIVVSLAATALSLCSACRSPGSWRARTFPGRSVLRAIVVLPIVLPPVVGGIGLLNALGRSGVVGRWLYEGLGIQLTFTVWGAIIAATFVSMPLVVLATEAGLRSLDRRYEVAAAALGASPRVPIRRVVLPMLAPSARRRARCSRGRERSGSSAPRSRSPGTWRAARRRFRSRSIRRGRPTRAAPSSCRCILVALSLAVLVAMRDRITQAR